MKAEVLLFALNKPIKTDFIEFEPFRCDWKNTFSDENSGVVCLIEDKWMNEFIHEKLLFESKGTRHWKKPLTYYFKKSSDRLLFVNGSEYKKYNKLKSSINKFLENASSMKLNSLFFLLVSKEFFEIGKAETIVAKSCTEVNTRNYQNSLLNLITPVKTEIDLTQRYIGNSEPCMLVRQMIATASQHDFPVLILGETGTGKEVVARNIHECSKRSNKPFISINCGAIPTELFESELFGYLADSHSTAKNDKIGLWKVADQGTLFLDEIGDLMLNHQVKILRAIETNEILPIGATKPINVNVRIIAATNKNIDVLATDKSESFREDLYYRISTFIIRTPTISSHPEDIPKIAAHFWSKLSNKRLHDRTLNMLKYMNWPGNVRSLKHFLQRIYALFGDQTITEEHIRVLQFQELENYLKITNGKSETGKPLNKDEFERAILKMEFLLKAALYSESEESRKDLLNKVKEGLTGML